MSCPLEPELTAYLDGELEPGLRQKVEAHLGTCADCRQTEALLRRTLTQLHQLPQLEPSLGARRDFLARLDRESDPWRVRLSRWLRPTLFVPASGLLAAAVVALVLVHPWHRGGGLGGELEVARQLELASNLEVAENYEVLGVDSPEDVDVVAHLSELESTP